MYKNQEAYDVSQGFYKGNLHCHSTVSDGKLTHEQLIALYKSHGYSFICFSDHETFTDNTALDTQDFISLPGVEWACDHEENGLWIQTYHVHGIRGTKDMVACAKQAPIAHMTRMPRLPFEGVKTVSKMLEFMVDRGNFTIYNHPLWSCTTPIDFGMLDGYTAMEVFNFSCDLENHTAFGDVYWDMLLSQGSKILAVATDDNHNNITPDDSCGGWICVNAPRLTHEDIVSSIIAGRFYASSGPVIKNYGVHDGEVFVSCEPVHHINFIANGAVALGQCLWSLDGGDSLNGAKYKLRGKEKYVRIECVDKFGKIAWSNPLFPQDP
jgi:hypothetical protein